MGVVEKYSSHNGSPGRVSPPSPSSGFLESRTEVTTQSVPSSLWLKGFGSSRRKLRCDVKGKLFLEDSVSSVFESVRTRLLDISQRTGRGCPVSSVTSYVKCPRGIGSRTEVEVRSKSGTRWEYKIQDRNRSTDLKESIWSDKHYRQRIEYD